MTQVRTRGGSTGRAPAGPLQPAESRGQGARAIDPTARAMTPARHGADASRWLRACTVCACLASPVASAAPEDARSLARLPAPALATLREEMLGNLRALHQIIELVSTGKVTQAGDLAERELGVSAMGRHRQLPLEARPGPHMPAAMHALGIEGHQAASRFAREASSGDRERALAALPALTTACVSCHHAYRTR